MRKVTCRLKSVTDFMCLQLKVHRDVMYQCSWSQNKFIVRVDILFSFSGYRVIAKYTVYVETYLDWGLRVSFLTGKGEGWGCTISMKKNAMLTC